MINVMNTKSESEKGLDPQLWHALAGGMVHMPPIDSKVYYFPQGHAENASNQVDFADLPLPSMVLCRVITITYLADVESDEVFAKLKLLPLRDDVYIDQEFQDTNDSNEKTLSFAKTLTQSDANNGGGFSVPRYCAETIFPRLDYNSEPPVQTILAKDVHGNVWKFRHIYRGTPRRHLLTTGWSTFVNQKKLMAGDSIVFMRCENGEICVGIRRAKRGGIGSWNPIGGSCGYSEEERRSDCSLVTVESVIEAATLAVNGRMFEVVYYPRASASEFCVKVRDVRGAMRIPWCYGMRFKMAFETEDSSRISWFMGTVSAANVLDPIRWPNSPWRLLQVAWDEPELLQNVKRVNPWLVELVSNVHPIPLPSLSPPRKKIRLPQHPDYNNLINSIPVPSFPSNPLIKSSPLSSIGLQGARHNAHHYYGLSSSNLHHYYFNRPPPPPPSLPPLEFDSKKEKGFCFSTESKKSHIVLFGKLILPEQKSSDGSNQNGVHDVSGLETGHCKVFMESDDVGRTLDLSVLGSYEELNRKLSDMFGIQKSQSVLYRDASGAIKYAGNEPFSDFLKTARRLTIRTEQGSESVVES